MAIDALAFRAQRQAVDVAADPAVDVPGQGVAVVGISPFQLVGKQQEVGPARVHGVQRQVGEGGGAVGGGWRRDRRATGAVRWRTVVAMVVGTG